MWYQSPVQTVYISATTAALVTLMIEYFAKPHLEVRKDRMLETRRFRREFMTRLLQLAQQIARKNTLVNSYSRELDRAQLHRFIADVNNFVDEYPRFAQAISYWKRKLIAHLFAELSDLGEDLKYHLEYAQEGGVKGNELEHDPSSKRNEVALYEPVFKQAYELVDTIRVVLDVSLRHPRQYYIAKKTWRNLKDSDSLSMPEPFSHAEINESTSTASP